jgi:epoxyqueuosine reductase
MTLQDIQQLAETHGFDDLKITDASEHKEAAKTFAAWLEREYHADMDWVSRDPHRRSTPRQLVPDAASVIMLGVNYYRDTRDPPAGSGKVARYAAGTDYHRVIEKGLKSLIEDLRSRDAGSQHRYYVDYGPVLERAFAERSGLGFIGKSANLIHSRFGTYVFLATIITDARLPLSEPTPGTCGQCTRCIDICPTGALKGPFQVDANLCISYLTIENRGPIPRHLRAQIGSWLFGCDLCQEVCPYNARAERGRNVAIAGDTIAGTEMDVAELLGMRTDEEFSRRFSRSAVKRAKREGLVRNAAVVAGNLNQDALIPALKEACRDESPLVRGHAVWALGEYGEAKFLDAFRKTEDDPGVLSEIAAVIGEPRTRNPHPGT